MGGNGVTSPNNSHHRGIISGLQFTSTGSRFYSSSCDSTLAMYNISSFKLLKLLGNTVVMGTVSAPGTITLDHNNNKLAVVGPLAHTITIMDPDNLNEVSTNLRGFLKAPYGPGRCPMAQCNDKIA